MDEIDCVAYSIEDATATYKEVNTKIISKQQLTCPFFLAPAVAAPIQNLQRFFGQETRPFERKS